MGEKESDGLSRLRTCGNHAAMDSPSAWRWPTCRCFHCTLKAPAAAAAADDACALSAVIPPPAECLVAEATYRAKQPLTTGHLSQKAAAAATAAKAEALAKLNRQAARRYAAAYLRDPTVNRAYDRLLPHHLDSEATRTLPLVHARNKAANQVGGGTHTPNAPELWRVRAEHTFPRRKHAHHSACAPRALCNGVQGALLFFLSLGVQELQLR